MNWNIAIPKLQQNLILVRPNNYLYTSLYILRALDDIIIKKVDKDRAVVILDVKDYIMQVKKHLINKKNYKNYCKILQNATKIYLTTQ